MIALVVTTATLWVVGSSDWLRALVRTAVGSLPSEPEPLPASTSSGVGAGTFDGLPGGSGGGASGVRLTVVTLVSWSFVEFCVDSTVPVVPGSLIPVGGG